MNKTDIEWADFSWNPLYGCNIGCGYCYARIKARELSKFSKCAKCKTYTPHIHKERLLDPNLIKRHKYARIFTGSMCDFWSPGMELEWRSLVWDVIREKPNLDFFILTKKPDRISFDSLPRVSNLFIGVTVEGPRWFNRLKWILESQDQAPTIRFFASFEPLCFDPAPDDDAWDVLTELLSPLDWVIAGAMTGPHSKKYPMNPTWALKLKDISSSLEIPFSFKRASDGGRLLDGMKIEEFPVRPDDQTVIPSD